MVQQINLQEYQESNPVPLEVDERDQIRDLLSSVSIEPVKHTSNKYRLKPGSIVGALETEGLSVLIEPKIGIPQLLSLACYAMGVYKPQEQHLFDFQKDHAPPDALALALISAARRAFGRGLQRGYLIEEEALHTVRGRIRFDEQIRRRYSIPLPVELQFDEFTEDILANQLVKAAAVRLRQMTLNSLEARRGLGWIAAILENVSLIKFSRRNTPEVSFDRLNEHYRHVIGLARLILLHSGFESFRGDVRANGFLIDMNKLFQEFVFQALRERLRDSESILRAETDVYLDVNRKVRMLPDLSLWEGSKVCTFVGDAKYKNLTDGKVPNSDLYQLLAYATAFDLPCGLLIYAEDIAGERTFTVERGGKRLETFSLSLSGPLRKTLARVDTLACKIKSLHAEALSAKVPAKVVDSRHVGTNQNSQVSEGTSVPA